MKPTNNFRKCPYCPHHKQQKSCCCRRPVSTRPKSKSKKAKKPQSAVSQINTTLPISVSNFDAMPNIIAQNSILRTENDYLKRELNTQYNSISTNYNNKSSKDSPITTVFPQSQNESSRTHYLQDKLYLSNKKLQQVLVQIDNLSKTNKTLHEINIKLQMEAQKFKIQNQQILQELSKYKKKTKKLLKQCESLPNKNQIEKLIRNSQQLERDNQYLRDQINTLKQVQYKLKKQLSVLQNKAYQKADSFSPEWVAHTSTKINALQKNISKLQQQNNRDDRSTLLFDNHTKAVQNNDNFQQIKFQLIAAIKTLKTQSQSFQFSRTLNELICTDYTPILSLIKSLCESFLEPLMSSYTNLEKQLDRKMKAYQIKFQKVIQRMHNMIMKIQNQRLRARAFNRKDFSY